LQKENRRMESRVWKTRAVRGLNQLSEFSFEGFQRLHGEPYRSLNSGASGIAYAFWKAACVLEDPHYLHQARFWIDRILEAPEDKHELKLDEAEGGTIRIEVEDSFSHGNRGVEFVKILVSYSQVDDNNLNRYLEMYREPAKRSREVGDLLQGIPGRLLGFAIMYDEMGFDYIREAGDKVAEELLDTADLSSDRPLWSDNPYLGMAHGRAGIYYPLLFWSLLTGYQLPARMVDDLKRQAEFGLEQKDGLRWPMRADSNERFMDSWCHGTPGQLQLWALAYRLYRDRFFLEMARKAGEYLINIGEYPMGHVCCGAAGISYSLLALNNMEPDGPWLENAARFAENADKAKLIAGYRLGLYTGLAGVVCLMLDMMEPEEARQPGFQG